MADASFWSAGDDEAQASGRSIPEDDLRLIDGSRVAVIGGGPAGSMFSYFLLRTLDLTETDIHLDIFEPRHFDHQGPAGCNHCGGIVSESLVQILAAEGINLPADVVQRGIESYMLHMDVGSVRIDTPLHEKRIAAVYRGNGPRSSIPADLVGFDRHLLDLAVSTGASIERRLVTDVSWADGRPRLKCPDGFEAEYDFVVVASGVNSVVRRLIQELGLGYEAPATVKTFIAEFQLGREVVEEQFGASMHVFLLDLPRLEFAALIPKGEYATVCMLGHQIDDSLVNAFLNSREVRERFPGSRVPENVCHCFPRINVQGARRPYADRMVMVGDCGVTRLYKDGIGAAYRTAKAAAMTAALHGISRKSCARHYRPACRAITFDNSIGRLVFLASHLFQKKRFSRKAVLRMTAAEQAQESGPRLMSSVLWDVFTGSAPYRDVLVRTMRPGFIGGLIWNLLATNGPWAAANRTNGAEK